MQMYHVGEFFLKRGGGRGDSISYMYPGSSNDHNRVTAGPLDRVLAPITKLIHGTQILLPVR